MSQPEPIDMVAETRALYEAIRARMLGEAVTSFGQKGRSLSYATASLDEMLRLYAQWWPSYGAAAGVPPISPEPGAHIRRGRPLRPRFWD